MNPDQPSREQIEARITALLLGELPAEEADLLRWTISQDAELQKLHDQLKVTIGFVSEAMKNPAGAPVEREAPLKLPSERRQALLAHFKTPRPQTSFWLRRIEIAPLIPTLVVIAIIALLAAIILPVRYSASTRGMFRASVTQSLSTSQQNASVNNTRQIEAAVDQWNLETGQAKKVPPSTDAKQQFINNTSSEVAWSQATPVSPVPQPAPIALPNTETSQPEVYPSSVVGYVNLTVPASPSSVPNQLDNGTASTAESQSPVGYVNIRNGNSAPVIEVSPGAAASSAPSIAEADSTPPPSAAFPEGRFPSTPAGGNYALAPAPAPLPEVSSTLSAPTEVPLDSDRNVTNGVYDNGAGVPGNREGGFALAGPLTPTDVNGSVSVPTEYTNDVIQLKYAKADDVARTLNTMGIANGGTVSFGSATTPGSHNGFADSEDQSVSGAITPNTGSQTPPTPLIARENQNANTLGLSIDRSQPLTAVRLTAAPAPPAGVANGPFTARLQNILNQVITNGVAENPPVNSFGLEGGNRSPLIARENENANTVFQPGVSAITPNIYVTNGIAYVTGYTFKDGGRDQSSYSALTTSTNEMAVNESVLRQDRFYRSFNGFGLQGQGGAPLEQSPLITRENNNASNIGQTSSGTINPATGLPENAPTAPTPVLGDVPIVGRLFTTPATPPQQTEERLTQIEPVIENASTAPTPVTPPTPQEANDIARVGLPPRLQQQYVEQRARRTHAPVAVTPIPNAPAPEVVTIDAPPTVEAAPQPAVVAQGGTAGSLYVPPQSQQQYAQKDVNSTEPQMQLTFNDASTSNKSADMPSALQKSLPQYEMRASKVDNDAFYAGLENVSSFLYGSTNITTNNTQVASGGGGLLYVTTPNSTRDVTGLARQYFANLGIKLNPPEQVYYNDRLGELFVYATPQDEDRIERALQEAKTPSTPAQNNLADNETIPPGLIDFQGVDASQVLEVYAQLTGRTLLRTSIPNAQIDLRTESRLTKAEAVQTLEKVLALHGIAVVNVGDKFLKAVPVSEAGTAAAQSDKPLAAPMIPAPIPQPEILTSDNAFSTFSLNVSDVSFKLAAASLEKGRMPDPGSIRSEEFINAFDYRDPEPLQGEPLAFKFERAQDPFAQERDFLRFSIKAAAAGRPEGRALNLVLLLDTSGSMERADRVAIIREALRVLASQLQPQDTVSVVTFARTARLWADGIPGDQAGATLDKVGSITPEGGTNLEEAMRLAYETARRHFLANGMNRVVLLTDGAANLGNVEPQTLTQKVETERRQGIALDCFGIGWEDYNDDLLEQLSSNGDGRYAFINSPGEATTEFAAKLAGALQVAAEDVKVQVEFNPNRVTAWRQIGYAKHQLTKQQFRDNTVAAGAIASREAGNGLYVIATKPDGEGPIATVRVRYRVPGTQENLEKSWLVEYTGAAPALEQASPAMRLTSTAAETSEWLANSPFAQEVTPEALLNYLSGVPQFYSADERPKQLEWMIRQAKSVSGK